MSATLDQTIRPANVAVLLKLEAAEGIDAGPSAAVDAIPIEADSVSYNSPWTSEASAEATGSLVASAPLIIGQAATLSFKSRIKGAGAGAAYTASVKPPLHQALQACGWRGQFTAAIAAAAASAGTGTTATLANGFPATADALLGMLLQITAGTGAGSFPAVIDYSAARVALLGDSFATPLDATSIIGLPANWTYASTSPSDAASRATDQPSATIYVYEDGVLWKYVGCRGTVTLEGQNARPGYATFNMTGIFAGRADTAIPAGLVVAGHSAPVLAQGSSLSLAAALNRKSCTLSTWSLDPGSQIEVPDNPNTPFGFDSGQVVDRAPVLKVDPLATLVANRDTIADIGNGVQMSAVLRHGSVAGNRWSLTAPLVQKTTMDPGTRGKLRSEQIGLQCISSGKDAFGRDSDRILAFS
jgi:hypothetical protein